jgi:hypothetical protein
VNTGQPTHDLFPTYGQEAFVSPYLPPDVYPDGESAPCNDTVCFGHPTRGEQDFSTIGN